MTVIRVVYVESWKLRMELSLSTALLAIIYESTHDDDIKGKHFPRVYWPFVREPTGHRWIPLAKASDAELKCIF